MVNETLDLDSPTSVYQTDRVSAAWGMAMPLFPLYLLAGIFLASFPTDWRVWVGSIVVLAPFTAGLYKYYDCSRSKKIELFRHCKALAIHGFVYPKGFFDIWPKKKVVLQYSDICEVKQTSYKGTVYYLVFTHDSKFRFFEHLYRSDELYDVLRSIADENDHPQSRSEKSHASAIRALWIATALVIFLSLSFAAIVTYF